MRKLNILFFSCIIFSLIIGCSSDDGNEGSEKLSGEERTELFISAAASLTDAMDEVQSLFEEEYNVDVTFNFAGSGKLAQQIQQGAPVDLFISANENWMDRLVEDGLIRDDTRVDVTGNKLVLIKGNESPIDYHSFEEISPIDIDQVAIGNPESVPAGEYTESALRAIGLWDALEGKFIFAQDVRQVLTYVETGNTEIGFVYESDAMSSDKVEVVAESDPSMHDAIIYPGAVMKDSEQVEVAEQFIDFLVSTEGQKILSKYGFNLKL